MSRCSTVDYFYVAILTNLRCHPIYRREEHGIQCTVYAISSQIIREIHTMERFDFLKSIINSQIIHFSVINGLTVCKQQFQ